MRTFSWVLLMLVGALTLLGGLNSADLTYRRGGERIAGIDVKDVANGNEALLSSLRARRGTAAAYATGFATFFLFVVLGPYRRGDVWSWWAILVSTLAFALVTVIRIPLLGNPQGTIVAGIQAGVVVVALLLDVGRLSKG